MIAWRNEVMKKMAFTMTPRFLVGWKILGNTNAFGGSGKLMVDESKWRFLRNSAGDADKVFRIELWERLDEKKIVGTVLMWSGEPWPWMRSLGWAHGKGWVVGCGWSRANTIIKGSLGVRQKWSQRSRRKKQMLLHESQGRKETPHVSANTGQCLRAPKWQGLLKRARVSWRLTLKRAFHQSGRWKANCDGLKNKNEAEGCTSLSGQTYGWREPPKCMPGQSKCSLPRWPLLVPLLSCFHHRLTLPLIVISVPGLLLYLLQAPSSWDPLPCWGPSLYQIYGADWTCRWSAAVYGVNEWSEARPWSKFPDVQTGQSQRNSKTMLWKMCDGKKDGWEYEEAAVLNLSRYWIPWRCQWK